MPDIRALVARLRALGDDRSLSRRRVRRAQEIADRLSRPARVSLLGLPSGGLVALGNALLGGEILRPDWPTTRVLSGPAPAYRATLADRRVIAGEGLPDPAALGAPVALLEVSAPLELLADLTLLVVRAGADWREQQAALHWAGRQTDISLWCSAGMTGQELEIWRAAPRALTNHGFLLSPGGPVAGAGGDFAGHVDTADPAWPGRLRAALAALVAEARTEDAAAAAMFLRDAGVAVIRRAPGAGRDAAPLDNAVGAAAPGVGDGREPVRDVEAWKLASRLFLALRRGAADVLCLLDADRPDAELATDLLARTESLLAALREMLDKDHGAGSGLPDIIAEAEETVILLKYEGGLNQARTAASLLVQVRQDIETYLEQAA